MLELQLTSFIFANGYLPDSCTKKLQGLLSDNAYMMASVCICVVAKLYLASLFKHHGVIEHLQSPYGAVQFIKLTGTGGVFSRTMCPDCSLLHCSFLCLGAAGTRTAPDIPQQARKKEACGDRNCSRS